MNELLEKLKKENSTRSYLEIIQLLFDTHPNIVSIELDLADIVFKYRQYDNYRDSYNVNLNGINQTDINLYESPVEFYENLDLKSLLMELNIKYGELLPFIEALNIEHFALYLFLFPYVTRKISNHSFNDIVSINKTILKEMIAKLGLLEQPIIKLKVKMP